MKTGRKAELLAQLDEMERANDSEDNSFHNYDDVTLQPNIQSIPSGATYKVILN